MVSFKNSRWIYLRKTWPMQAWIPVVSWSLYFWKSVFSFRADSILKSDGDLISNWKFPDCVPGAFLWCMSQTNRDRNNSLRVRTHKKNSGETVRRLGTTIQSIFVPNQEPASAWIFGNGSVRVGTQGLFRAYLKTFVAPFLPTRLTAPGSPSHWF